MTRATVGLLAITPLTGLAHQTALPHAHPHGLGTLAVLAGVGVLVTAVAFWRRKCR